VVLVHDLRTKDGVLVGVEKKVDLSFLLSLHQARDVEKSRIVHLPLDVSQIGGERNTGVAVEESIVMFEDEE